MRRPSGLIHVVGFLFASWIKSKSMNKIIKKTLLGAIVSLSIASPLKTSAAIVVPCVAFTSVSDCQKLQQEAKDKLEKAAEESRKIAEENKIKQDALDAQKLAEEKLKEKEEKDRKLKIEELEARVRNLETQKPSVITPPAPQVLIPVVTTATTEVKTPVVQRDTKQTITVKKAEPKTTALKKEEFKAIEQSISTSTVIIPQAPIEQAPAKKSGWWTRLINWFKK